MSNLFNIAELGATFVAGGVVVGVLQRLAFVERLRSVSLAWSRAKRLEWLEAAVPELVLRRRHRLGWFAESAALIGTRRHHIAGEETTPAIATLVLAAANEPTPIFDQLPMPQPPASVPWNDFTGCWTAVPVRELVEDTEPQASPPMPVSPKVAAMRLLVAQARRVAHERMITTLTVLPERELMPV